MIVVSLFDYTCNFLQPWLEAGYDCYAVDIQHPPAYDTGGITSEGRLHKVHADLSRPWLPPFRRNQIAFVAAWPPCDHQAVSGARWFRGKGLRRFADAVAMVATAAEFCEWSGAPYMIENPVSTMSSYWRKPDHTFHPWNYAGYCDEDTYSKKTCLWTGNGFVMPEEQTIEGAVIDDRIHKCPPGPDRANIRSATPMGFARAVFEANHTSAYLPGTDFSKERTRKVYSDVAE